jgi:hypothetical protein
MFGASRLPWPIDALLRLDFSLSRLGFRIDFFPLRFDLRLAGAFLRVNARPGCVFLGVDPLPGCAGALFHSTLLLAQGFPLGIPLFVHLRFSAIIASDESRRRTNYDNDIFHNVPSVAYVGKDHLPRSVLQCDALLVSASALQPMRLGALSEPASGRWMSVLTSSRRSAADRNPSQIDLEITNGISSS